MRMENRRQSTNVENRRGKVSTKAAAGGVGGIGIIGVVLYFILSGGNVNPAVVSQLSNASTTTQTTNVQSNDSEFYKNNKDFANEDELYKFATQILASTEDIWTENFKKQGKTYKAPKMVIFAKNTTTGGCGNAESSMGPFYCPADQTVYLDLNFVSTMKKSFGAEGDFAFAYVIAHEVGHHIQYLTGELGKYQTMEQSLKKAGKKAESNLVSVQIELEADCYAGLWGHDENKTFKSLESTDFMEAFQTAKSIGDDSLGNRRRETFSHGSAKMRQKWFKTGFEKGDMAACSTYSYPSLDALEK